MARLPTRRQPDLVRRSREYGPQVVPLHSRRRRGDLSAPARGRDITVDVDTAPFIEDVEVFFEGQARGSGTIWNLAPYVPYVHKGEALSKVQKWIQDELVKIFANDELGIGPPFNNYSCSAADEITHRLREGASEWPVDTGFSEAHFYAECEEQPGELPGFFKQGEGIKPPAPADEASAAAAAQIDSRISFPVGAISNRGLAGTRGGQAGTARAAAQGAAARAIAARAAGDVVSRSSGAGTIRVSEHIRRSVRGVYHIVSEHYRRRPELVGFSEIRPSHEGPPREFIRNLRAHRAVLRSASLYFDELADDIAEGRGILGEIGPGLVGRLIGDDLDVLERQPPFDLVEEEVSRRANLPYQRRVERGQARRRQGPRTIRELLRTTARNRERVLG